MKCKGITDFGYEVRLITLETHSDRITLMVYIWRKGVLDCSIHLHSDVLGNCWDKNWSGIFYSQSKSVWGAQLSVRESHCQSVYSCLIKRYGSKGEFFHVVKGNKRVRRRCICHSDGVAFIVMIYRQSIDLSIVQWHYLVYWNRRCKDRCCVSYSNSKCVAGTQGLSIRKSDCDCCSSSVSK